METFMWTLTVLIFLNPGMVTSSSSGSHVADSYCLPGEACWPGPDDILFLDDSISGRVFQPLDPEYNLLSPTNSLHHRKHPAIIAQEKYLAKNLKRRASNNFQSTDQKHMQPRTVHMYHMDTLRESNYDTLTMRDLDVPKSFTGQKRMMWAINKTASLPIMSVTYLKVVSIRDVQKVVLFAQRFNIRLAIYSTGHDFMGRSTAHGCLQISLVNMDRIDINLSDSASDTGASVTVQTGNTWRRIYQAVDGVGKVVVGGYCLDVSPGGYTAGGGYSPLSRYLGLAVDNCIAATIVLADGHVAYLNSTGTTLVALNGQMFSFAYTDLFWAIRGGGGGTYGVIIDYTFKLHEPPAQLVVYAAQYPIDGIGEMVINFLHQLVPTLPYQWFGAFMYTVPSTPVPGVTGVISIFFLHYGPWEQTTRMAIQPLELFLPEMRITHRYQNHTSYWSVAQTVINVLPFRGYFGGIFIPVQKLTSSISHLYVNTINTAPLHLNGTYYLCAESTIGGRISEFNGGSNAVSQNFRQAMINAFCVISWDDPRSDRVGNALGRSMAEELYQHSQGAYLNEAAYDLPNWRQDFWGSNYNHLLALKRMWDRNNVFYCRHCVGDDSDARVHPPGGASVLEGPAN